MRSAVLISTLITITLSAVAATTQPSFSEADRQWWAIQPVSDPPIPSVTTSWPRNPIDQFITRKLASASLKPAPEASPRELVRRLYFDLHGLPPSPEQVIEFLTDPRPDAWQRLVRNLLDSPRYGERWGQHWLDVVRYAESDGYREDAFRPRAHLYRDYVIRSFNTDKPYDQFVREQLAGDEIDPDDPDVFIGTAFLRNGIYEWNQRDVRMHWDLIINEMTRVTGEAFLGIGIGCAQCHDHKFDPILQKDYFALQSFLSTTSWPLQAWLAPRDQVADYQRQLRQWENETKTIRAEMNELVKASYEGKINYTVGQFPPDIQAIYHKPAQERTPYEEQLAYLVERQVERAKRTFNKATALKGKPDKLKRFRELEAELKQFLKPKPPPDAFIARDVGPQPARTFISSRTAKTEIEPAFLSLLGEGPPAIHPTKSSTGRRIALANWIARAENPLSTRVIVNRLWQHHFGQGLVNTPNDFGNLGEKPSHPELLDWLTSRFLENGWRFKAMHELILNSATYRQTARREPSPSESKIDPGNRLLWRFPPQRLAAEQVRDAMLAVSGELKHRVNGPSVNGSSLYRSVYVKKLRNRPDEILKGFDAPAGFDSAPTRVSTTTPLQSLLLINGEWVLQRAAALAKRILNDKSEMTETEVTHAYQLVLNRPPSKDEVSDALNFFKSQSTLVTAPAAPRDKFPNETGLRPITQQFGTVKDVALGDKSLWIQPGSRFERLALPDIQLSEDEFTIEAVANLDRLYPDASVNTLVSRWNSSTRTPGWSFGVTSEKSRYQPRNLILQLIGENFQGNPTYEVVASDLRFPLHKPVYFAAVISAAAPQQDRTSGRVTFYMKDLSDPTSPLQSRTVTTRIVGRIQNPGLRFLVGGRHSPGHLWDGQLARLTLTAGALKTDQLLINKSQAPNRIIDWLWNGDNGEEPAPNTAWYRPKAQTRSQPSRLLGATTDFCHALLNANEFLYLH